MDGQGGELRLFLDRVGVIDPDLTISTPEGYGWIVRTNLGAPAMHAMKAAVITSQDAGTPRPETT